MNKVIIALVAAFAVSTLAGCGTIGKGKGKGKAPAPAAVVYEEPAPAPISKY
jgi:hypothetical protein